MTFIWTTVAVSSATGWACSGLHAGDPGFNDKREHQASGSLQREFVWGNLFISYGLFLKEFNGTNSIADYERSLLRISERYNLKIPVTAIDLLYKKRGRVLDERMSLRVSRLTEQASKKANFLNNTFYETLEELEEASNDFLMGARLEIAIADQIRKLNVKAPHQKRSNGDNFRYLLNHARYMVFLHALRCSRPSN